MFARASKNPRWKQAAKNVLAVGVVTPWNAILRYRRTNDEPVVGMVCAENNGGYFNYDVVPIPHADRPDF